MFQEYDVIVNTKPLDNTPIGTTGTILIVYNDNNFEVEFIDNDGNTLSVLTVDASSIKERANIVDSDYKKK